MKQLLLLFFIAALSASMTHADDLVQFGPAVNGLRVGLQASGTVTTSDQDPTFTVTAENVSAQPNIIPAPKMFVHKSSPRSDDYHELPLTPVINDTAATR